MKDIFSCIAVIIGTIIGAGFASGKEIVSFFNIYGYKGYYGIIIANLIFGIVIVLTNLIIKKENIHKYEKLINNKFMFYVLKIFSFICFCIMISGVGAFAKEQLNINFWYGTMFATAFSYAIFLNKFKAVEIFSIIIVPIIIIGILLLGVSNYDGVELTKENEINIIENRNFIISAVLYASYNSLILFPVMINFLKYKLSNKKIVLIGVVSILILAILMNIIYKVNSLFYPEICTYELPNMMIASLISKKLKILYSIVILGAIFTTAFSCGFSFLKMSNEKNYERNALIICVLACICAKIGFSNLIEICFPFFGYFGIFQILLIIKKKYKE